MKARVIALYLPQFHPIRENNEAWGHGFTEWTNVVQAKPLFKGHCQPRLPADLGFYDLRVAEVREMQAVLARKAGIEGFMYWHYWMGNNRVLLEKPFQEVLASGKPNFPFCVGWANHSWSTRTWQKGKLLSGNKTIVEQLYPGDADIINHFYYLLPAFRDERYIRIDNGVVFMVYDPFSVPYMSKFIDIWRELAVKCGLGNIHFIGLRNGARQTSGELFRMGFDAVNNRSMVEAEYKAVGSRSMKRIRSFVSFKTGAVLQKYKYSDIIKHIGDDEDSLENVYPTIIPGYDRSPRAGSNAVIYYGSTPRLFGEHIDMVLNRIKDKVFEKKVIILKSWNEWGEGNYMEPDMVYGHGYLRVLAEKLGLTYG